MSGLLKDIASGALPASEFVGFIIWAISKTFWFWFAVILVFSIRIAIL